MGTTAQKLQAIANSKTNIKAAINEKGVEVDNLTPLSNYADKIRQISGSIDPTKPVLFFDYDGTLVASYTIAEAQALQALPEQPTHEYLTGDGWTHTLEEVRATTSALHIGAMYRTADGKTRAFVTLTRISGLSLLICFTVTGTATIRVDWGDGQTEDVTATSNRMHNYAAPGDYQITLERIAGAGTYSLGRGSTGGIFIGVDINIYKSTLTKLHIGDNATISSYAFASNLSLSCISIPRFIATLGAAAFNNCYSLKCIIIPNVVINLENLVFQNCYALSRAIIPRVTNIGNNVFEQCGCLDSMVLPQGLLKIGFSMFSSCRSLTSIEVPFSVTAIEANSFQFSYSAKEYIIKSEIPPTLANTSAFAGINPICKIYVPDESVEAYKTATNWANYADYIYPISERP